MKNIDDLQKLLNKGMRVIPDKLPRIVEVEGLRFIKGNFRKQGFQTGGGVEKWEKRNTEDKRGRDITRYRTNRVGTRGSLNRYGRKIKGRSILVGHNTGPDKLRNSFHASRSRKQVTFTTYKPYAQRHNEGLDGMPERQFMGPSKKLDSQIKTKLTKELDKIFR